MTALYGLARTILSLAHQNSHKRVTYSDIWLFYRGGEQPRGQWWIRKFQQPLTDLGNACRALDLPFINALIVRKITRDHSAAATKNMWRFAQEAGLAIGSDPAAFIKQQAQVAEQLTVADLDRVFGQTGL